MPLPGGYLLDTNILVQLMRNNDLGRYLEATYRFSTAASFGAHWNESEFSLARLVTMKSSDSPRLNAIAGTNDSTD